MNDLTDNFRLNEFQTKALKKLGITSVETLLRHIPSRYASFSGGNSIATSEVGSEASLVVEIKKIDTAKGFRSRIPMAKGKVSDPSGTLDVVWLNQPYIARMYPEGTTVRLSGKITDRKGKKSMVNPVVHNLEEGDSTGGMFIDGDAELVPVYAESRGISSDWLRVACEKIIKKKLHEEIVDPIPKEILAQYNLPTLSTAFVWAHAPKSKGDAEASRKRFAFEEVFFIQIERQMERKEWEANNSYKIEKTRDDLEKFISKFPYSLTGAQEKVIADVLTDFKSGKPMARLLEGDVGSGKTAVAAAAVYAVVNTKPFDFAQDRLQTFGSLQTAYMAPTEILATQHFESFIEYFVNSGLQVGLITGSGCRKFPSKVNPKSWTQISRTQLLKWVENGEIPILIGTHALIQKSVKWKHLALAIIDEQHRFGTKQRKELVGKSHIAPHLLSMTATPIPRTLALTVFGDLDLSLLDEMPAGRKQIITKIVPPKERRSAYEIVRNEIKTGRQAYVICPRIDEPDPEKEMAVLVKSVKEEAKRLATDVFPEFSIGILHSKMKPAEKDKVMKDFSNGTIKILVATSVVEVGVNVPNATTIIIEGAERFGLAQLHQLRGRVIRSNHQARCFVFADGKSEATLKRLDHFSKASNGFELAEFDLETRGAGDLAGGKQWGITDIGMEALKNIKMVEFARKEAREIIENDPELSKYPNLKTHIAEKRQKIHFE
ncbi:MAG: ATP-dependent DNA helicase RecG [Minisyncoccia bacterium]